VNESDFTTLVERARTDIPPSTPPTAEILDAAHRASTRRRLALGTGLAAVIAVAAIVIGLVLLQPDEGPPAIADRDAVVQLSGSWRLASGTVDGQPLVIQPDYPVTFVVETRAGKITVGGQSACNYYGSDLSASGSSFDVRSVESTAMGCAPPVQALEMAYLDALGEATEFEQTENRLTLRGSDVELRFVPLLPVPTAQLVDTIWKLETIVDGATASSVTGDPILELRSDGSFTMTSGCGLALTGRWLESGGAITITESSASGGCQQHAQSQAILNASDSFYVEIDGGQLTVTGRHGGELVYRQSAASGTVQPTFVGTAWLMTAVADGPGVLIPTGAPTLRFHEDGTFEFGTGCGSTLTGTWTQRGSMIDISRAAQLGVCARRSEQVDAIDRGIRDQLLVQLTDKGLSIMGAEGREMEFVAR